MGRPPLRKKGAFTAAERQARRRQKLRRAARDGEKLQKQAINAAKLDESNKRKGEWTVFPMEPARPPMSDPAEELAWQVVEALTEAEVSIDDFLAALARRIPITPQDPSGA